MLAGAEDPSVPPSAAASTASRGSGAPARSAARLTGLVPSPVLPAGPRGRRAPRRLAPCCMGAGGSQSSGTHVARSVQRAVGAGRGSRRGRRPLRRGPVRPAALARPGMVAHRGDVIVGRRPRAGGGHGGLRPAAMSRVRGRHRGCRPPRHWALACRRSGCRPVDPSIRAVSHETMEAAPESRGRAERSQARRGQGP